MTSPIPSTPPVLDMPALYLQRTEDAERERHADKLRELQRDSGLHVDALRNAAGDWMLELVTMDWEEPGLLDKIFEAILRCTSIPGGVSIQRARIFTGRGGQVVNMLELRDREGKPFKDQHMEAVLAQLRRIEKGERGVLETIQHGPFGALIPLLTEYPIFDNSRDPDYTYLEFRVDRLSNRFTSILLNFLARSDLWLNIQLAEFTQDGQGRYAFWVVDKNGRKLRDSHFTRFAMTKALESMNAMLIRFNVHYVARSWQTRMERNRNTIYLSRPDPQDLLADVEDLLRLAGLKGLEPRLGALVEQGLLDNRAFLFLQRAEAFCQRNQQRILAMREEAPDEAQIALCRTYFEHRRRAKRIVEPLYRKLADMSSVAHALNDAKRLGAMVSPEDGGRYCLDRGNYLYVDGPLWLDEADKVLEPFQIMARTGCTLREDLVEAVEAGLENWSPAFVAQHREVLGRHLLALLDESLHQGTTAQVLQHLRGLGVLQRLLPGFAHIQGLVHVVADHDYTVDEHTFLLIETLGGLGLLGQVVPELGKSHLRADYERLKDAVGLKNFARKYALEMRVLDRVPFLHSNGSLRTFFMLMGEVRQNSLDYLVDVNLLEFSYATSMDALSALERIRSSLAALIRMERGMDAGERRVLMLAGLLHDLKKPGVDHPERGAEVVASVLEEMGLHLPEADVARIVWLVRHHLDVRGLMAEMGKGDGAVVRAYAGSCGDPGLFRALLLFTFADRVAVRMDQTRNMHDAMLLTEMLELVEDTAA